MTTRSRDHAHRVAVLHAKNLRAAESILERPAASAEERDWAKRMVTTTVELCACGLCKRDRRQA